MTADVQETITEALVKPGTPRVWVHAGCGGWVLFSVQGGECLRCHAAPLTAGDYEKPGAA